MREIVSRCADGGLSYAFGQTVRHIRMPILPTSLPTASEGNIFRSVCHSVHVGELAIGGLPHKDPR